MRDAVMKENIQLGIHWLNTVAPGWYERIDLFFLSMEMSNLCVLGQVFGSYESGVARLGVTTESVKPVLYGFAAPRMLNEEEIPAYYERMTAAWKEQITQLRDKGIVDEGGEA